MNLNRIEVIDYIEKGEGRVYVKKGNLKIEIEY